MPPAPPTTIPPTPTAPTGPLTRWLRDPAGTELRWLHHVGHALTAAHSLQPIVVTSAGIALTYVLVAAAVRARWVRRGRWVAIAPPDEPDPAGGLALWRILGPLLTAGYSVVGRRPPVAFECVADPSGMRVGLWVSPTLSPSGVVRAVEAAWPGARATIARPPTLTCGRARGGQARLAAADWFPLAGQEPSADPIRGVLAALASDRPNTTAVVQILARPAARRRIARARRAALAIRRAHPIGVAGHALDLADTRRRSGSSATTDPLALADVRNITAKLADTPHFQVGIRYAVSDQSGWRGWRRRRARLRQLAAAFGLYTDRNRLIGHHLILPAGRLAGRRLRGGFLASAAELAALAHLPAEPAGYGLPAAPARTVAPPPQVAHA